MAFLPSVRHPHIPNTDLSDTLKIYGDADVTVSEDRVIVAPVAFGLADGGAF